MDILDGVMEGEGVSFPTPTSAILDTISAVHRNRDARSLVQRALGRGEGLLSRDGALVVDTGQHTGRSPRDKYLVREPETETAVAWDNNNAISRANFDVLKRDIIAHVRHRELFVQDLVAGVASDHQVEVTVYTEFAWQSLFIRNLLTPAAHGPDPRDRLTIIDVPSFQADPARHGVRDGTVIACDLARRLIIIAGTSYAGEIKKAVFTYLNYLLPTLGILPMHCSANVGEKGDVAIFFGLSGTGKTTLSATGARALIGDDEHGWGPDGVFNFEGGCYAKTAGLSVEDEPEIWAATNRFGTILENVAVEPDTGAPLFTEISRTENTRAAYPLSSLGNASTMRRGSHPKNIIMLAADAFGVLPPIVRLSPEQAIYYFLSGFTAKVAGTEKGVSAPEPTFSACFGAPFMPRPAAEYGLLLHRLIEVHRPRCWLLNTGWTGGPFGTGRRMPLRLTRRLVNAVFAGELDAVPFRTDVRFGFDVPTTVADVPDEVLGQRQTWANPASYDAQAARLAQMFKANFAKSQFDVGAAIKAAGPA